MASFQHELVENRMQIDHQLSPSSGSNNKRYHEPNPKSHSPVHPAVESPLADDDAATIQSPSATVPSSNGRQFISEENLQSVGPVQRFLDYGMFEKQPFKQPRHVKPLPGQCAYGQLTDKGRETLFRIGSSLRQLYVDNLKLLPENLTSESDSILFFRTTDYPRTLESLQHLIGGLYPRKSWNRTTPPHIHTRMAHEETLIGSGQCKRYRQLLKEFKNQYRANSAEHIETMKRKHAQLLQDPAKPNLHALYDTFIAQWAHGMPLPDTGVTPEDIFELEQHAYNLWFDSLQKEKQVARLAVGRFVNEWKAMLQSVVRKEGEYAQLKLSVFSGHDSTIAPVLGVFNAGDGKWPSFGANITVEVFEDAAIRSSADKYFVRLKYNQDIFNVPYCQQSGRGHPKMNGFCTWEAFLEIMDDHIPKDYEAECMER